MLSDRIREKSKTKDHTCQAGRKLFPPACLMKIPASRMFPRTENENKAKRETYQKALAEWTRAKEDYKINYEEATALSRELYSEKSKTQRELNYTKGLFNGKKKKELEEKLNDIEHKLKKLVIPTEPGKKPEEPVIWILNKPEKAAFYSEHSEFLREMIKRIKAGLSPSWGSLYNSLNSIKSETQVVLGQYPIDGQEKCAPVEWTVLVIRDKKALLLSKNGIDAKKYNDNLAEVTWETSSIREFMNTTMVDMLFSEYEKRILVQTKNINPMNPVFNTSGGKDTEDYIFLLNEKEVEQYLRNSSDKTVYPTPYALAKNPKKESSENAMWWIRTPGRFQSRVAYVDSMGRVSARGEFANAVLVLRPACWIDVSEF